jgi:DNA gyrase subunit A
VRCWVSIIRTAMAVYDAMARMAQDFSLRYLLVDGQGNFGSVDGDPPAAMRYTEARLAPPAMDMLADIQKNTVDFNDNFDGTCESPVLPAALPNLLGERRYRHRGRYVDQHPASQPGRSGRRPELHAGKLGQRDDIGVEDLMQFIKGPDFPTGGMIVLAMTKKDWAGAAYGSGRGRVTVQARAHFEEMSRGRNRIIVTELPYMTNKARLIERIAELVREERLEGVADLRDESDRQGLRIVIELKKTADPEK